MQRDSKTGSVRYNRHDGQFQAVRRIRCGLGAIHAEGKDSRLRGNDVGGCGNGVGGCGNDVGGCGHGVGGCGNDVGVGGH